MRESAIERYLVEKVRQLGGDTRKLRYVARAHAPDRLVLLEGHHFMVETKAPGETARPGQEREHARLRRSDILVCVLDTKEKIDDFLEDYR